ncbi:hypothetical protein [Spirosoma jeollabukense]
MTQISRYSLSECYVSIDRNYHAINVSAPTYQPGDLKNGEAPQWLSKQVAIHF